MVTMQDAIMLARRLVRADNAARAMPDYVASPDFAAIREVAQVAREFLKSAGAAQ